MAEYEVHLYGTWRRASPTFNHTSYVRGLNVALRREGLKVKATLNKELYYTSSGTFELEGDVNARSSDEALSKAEQILKTTMANRWCSPPTFTVE